MVSKKNLVNGDKKRINKKVNVTPTVNANRKFKEIDPFKVNAAQVLSRICFTKVEDRLLMNSEDIEKDESTKLFVGFDNPTTCQLNLNFLYCKAIASLEKRMALLERQMKNITANPVFASDEKICGKKRKRVDDLVSGTKDINVNSENINLDGDSTRDGFQNEVCESNGNGEAISVTMLVEESTAQNVA